MIRLCVSISFNILIEYNLEIYSTDIRATAFNINKLFSRVGDFTLPLILASNRTVATAIMGGLFLFMSIFLVKLKETRGEKLKETVEDSEKWEKEETDKENEKAVKSVKANENGNEEETKDLIEDDKEKNTKKDI
jgi:preprotein translocase subunit SecG